MSKYHINPKTGKPGICDPKVTGLCKYSENGEVPKHYTSEEEAITAYEHIGKAKFGAVSQLSKKSKIIGKEVRIIDTLSNTTIYAKVLNYDVDTETGEYNTSVSEYIDPETQEKFAIISSYNPQNKTWYIDDNIQASFQFYNEAPKGTVNKLKDSEIEASDGFSDAPEKVKILQVLSEDEYGINSLVKANIDGESVYTEVVYDKEDKQWYFM